MTLIGSSLWLIDMSNFSTDMFCSKDKPEIPDTSFYFHQLQFLDHHNSLFYSCVLAGTAH